MESLEGSIAVICVSLILSAFFSGMEIAYISANKIHIELEKKQNDFLSKILTRLTQKPSKFIATMLLGNNIALVVYGYYMGDVLQHWLEGMPFGENFQWLSTFVSEFSLLSQTIISTLVILLTAEFLPKVFFQIYANKLLKFFAIPAYFFYVLFSFLSSFVIWISDMVLKHLFKTDGDEVQLAFSKVELGNYISEQMESVSEHEQIDTEIQIFQNALEFSEVKSREVMIPRTEIIAVEENTSPTNLTSLFIESGLSKILVYKDTIDDIVGYVHSFALFKKPKTISSVLMPVVYVPETMLLFGEIEDEHDSIDLKEEITDDGYYHLSARLEVDYLNETYKLNLPESENYETLGGLVVSHTEEIPEEGETIIIDNVHIHILETSNTKIELIEIRPQEG